MRMMLPILLTAALAACATNAQKKARLGHLPVFDKPPCTEAEKVSLGLDECTRRLLAFVGRGMQSTVLLRSVTTTRKGETSELKGVGVVVDGHGRILTAYNVVHDAQQIVAVVREVGGADGRLFYEEERTVPMRIKAFTESLNMALLEPAQEATLPNPFVVDPTVRAFGEGEALWFFGSSTLFRSGLVSLESEDLDSLEHSGDLYEVGIPASRTDLGGAVFTPEGKIVGVVVGLAKEGAASYFVPVSTATQLFDLQVATGPDVEATPDIAAELDGYLSGGEWSAAGMCDRMRTTLYRIEGPQGVTVTGIIPTTDDQFVDVKIESDGTETHRYFIKRRPVGSEKSVVVELQGMAWGLSLRSQSLNAYYFHYQLGQTSDCSM